MGNILLFLISFCLSSLAENSTTISIEGLNKVDSSKEITFGAPFAKEIFSGREDLALEFGPDSKIFPDYEVVSKWSDGSARVIVIKVKMKIKKGEKKEVKLLWGDYSKEKKEIIEKENKEIPEKIPDWQKEQMKKALMNIKLQSQTKSKNGGDLLAFVRFEPDWYCYSKVWGDLLPSAENVDFKKYEERLKSSFERNVKTYRRSGKAELSYYDLAHTLYQAFLRSGKKEYFLAAHKEAKRFIEEEVVKDGPYKGQHINGKGNPLPWRGLRLLYMEGLIDDYILTGDKESFEVAKSMADVYLRGINNKDLYVNERNPGWPILELLAIYELTSDRKYFNKAREIIDIVLSWQDSARGGWIRVYEDKEECPHGHKGGSPFMTTVLLEGLIRYHIMTGDEKVKESILKANNWLINEAYIPQRKTFVYIQCPEYKRSGGVYTLNPMFIEMLGYAYHISKDEKYLKVALEFFKDTILKGEYANHIKEFTQCFRSSGRGLYWLV